MALLKGRDARLLRLGNSYFATAPGYVIADEDPEPETLTHMERVAAAGGTGAVQSYVNAAILRLKTRGILANLLSWTDPRFGYTTDALTGKVTRLFSLNGAAGDAITVPGFDGPVIMPLGFNDRPDVVYNNALLRIPSLPFGGITEYSIITLWNIAGGGEGTVMGWGPYNQGFLNIQSRYGYPRFFHVQFYGGTEMYIPVAENGNATTYIGEYLRTFVRFEANRSPFEVILAGNGFAQNGYISGGIKGPLPAIDRDFLLGGGWLYDTLSPGPACQINTCCILNTNALTPTVDVDAFVRDQFNMFT
jgi:hypothetical protein